MSNCGPLDNGEYYDTVADYPGGGGVSNCKVKFKMQDVGGRVVLHCHILRHEDLGAMGWINVIGGKTTPSSPCCINGECTPCISEPDLPNCGVMNPVVRKTYMNASAYTDTSFVPSYSTSAQADVSVRSNPYSVKLIDLNNDGELDLITTNYGNNTVSIALGVGNGVFSSAVSHTTGIGPIGVDAGDFNLDGIPDIVVTNIGEHTVSCLFGDGAGGVASQVKYGTGTSPFGITIADLNTNGAGYEDIIVSNFEENTLSILWSYGDGTFVPAGTLFTGVNTRRLVAAKLTGSGVFDLICANQLDNNVGVFIGTGGGTFAPQVTHTVGNGPIGLATNDMNGDGNRDVLTSNFFSDDVAMLLGDSNGGFGLQLSIPVGVQPFDVQTGDFNGDGLLDIITGNFGDNTVSIVLGESTSQFAKSKFYPAIHVPVCNQPIGVTVGDMNKDGKDDFVVACFGDDKAAVYLSQSDVVLETSTPGNVVLRIEILNPNHFTLTNVAFNDVLPTQLQVTSPGTPINYPSCSTATSTTTAVSLTAGQIPSFHRCWYDVLLNVVSAGDTVNTVTVTGDGGAVGNSNSANLNISA